MLVIKQHRIYREDLRNNPHLMYIFGDNEERWGLGGQAAEMRGEPNAFGIATLKAPGVFWSDEDYLENTDVILDDINRIFKQQGRFKGLVIPSDGVGTGLANLEAKAPRTFKKLQELMVFLEFVVKGL